MAVPMIQIDWLDGRITRYPEISVGDAFGSNVQPEVEIKLDDTSNGIWILVRHNEPDQPQKGVYTEDDPRGLPCTVYADCFYQIATAADMAGIAVLRYEGEPRLVNDGGQLINLSKFNALKNLYLGEDAGAISGQAAALFAVLQERNGGNEEQIAEMMGLPVSFLAEARRLALLNRDDEEGASAEPPASTAKAAQPSETAGLDDEEEEGSKPSPADNQAILAAAFGAAGDDEDDYDFS